MMWRLERTPGLSSTFGSLTLLDRVPKITELRRRLANAAAGIPRLRSRIVEGEYPLMPCSWVEDPYFRVEDHVRHITLPAPGRLADLVELAGRIINDPLDPHRPLWDFTVIDGVREKSVRAAIVQRTHHAVADGESTLAMSLYFTDLERNPAAPLIAPPEPADEPGSTNDDDALAPASRFARGVRDLVGGMLADPVSLVGQLVDTHPARSPLWTARSTRRRFEIIDFDFEPLYAACKRLEGTLNTGFVTIVADAAGRYHRALGEPVDTLRLSMAVSSRPHDDSAAHDGEVRNAFGLARLTVPTGEMPVADRFRAVCDAAAAVRTGGASSVSVAATLLAAAPTALVARLAKTQAATVDIATSNVRAAPCDVFIAGAKVLGVHPAGPLMGVPANITMLSYAGRLHLGIHLDPAAITEPARLVRALRSSYRALVGRAASRA